MIPEHIARFAVKLAVYGAIVPVLVALFYRKRLSRPVQYYLGWLVLFYLVANLIHSSLSQNGINNQFFSHFNPIIKLGLFLLIFQELLTARFRKWLFVVFVMLSIVGTLFLYSLQEKNFIAEIGMLVILAGISVYFFVTEMRKDTQSDWLRRPIVWVALGNLVYCTTSLMYMLLYNWLLEKEYYDTMKSLSGIRSMSAVVQLLLFTFALWIHPPSKHKFSTSP